MPEQPGPSEQPESGPAFNISPEEAANIGLTNNDLARYRWTGEMPPHVQELERQTFRDQTRPGAQKFWVTKEEVSMADAAAADIPKFKDFDEYKVWSLQELERIPKRIARSLADPRDVHPAEVAQQAARWAAASRNYWNIGYDDDFKLALDRYTPVADEILASPNSTAETKADLLDAVALPLGVGDRTYSLLNSLTRDLEHNGPEFLAQLLERPTKTGSIAMNIVVNTVNSPKTSTTVEDLSPQLIGPLARRVHAIVSGPYISGASSEMEVINLFMDELGRSDVTMKQAKASGVDFQQIADTIFQGYADRRQAVSDGSDWFYHYDAQTIITVLDKLYLPDHGAPLKLPAELPEFLEPIYRHKLEHYGSRSDIDQFRMSFNHLAAACGIKQRAYRK